MDADSVLTLREVAAQLRLDPRTVKKIACNLGGKRVGKCWRFRWGNVVEFFYADIEKGQGRHVAGPCRDTRQRSRQQALSGGQEKGPEWMAARQWELDKKAQLLTQKTQPKTLTGSEQLLAFADQYLSYVQRTMSRATYVEKKTIMQSLFAFCRANGITGIDQLTKPVLYQYLCTVADDHTAKRANVYRKNLLAAWNWALDDVEGFPQTKSPLERLKPFPVNPGARYVPPEEDIIKVMQQAEGQDLVMLMVFYFTGARRGEVFRLRWEDVRLESAKIRLTDHKAGQGRQRERWLTMHPELVKALAWWRTARPCRADNVFMQLQSQSELGAPFKQRNKLMARLCQRAGVRPFGFHAIRHKAASVAFAAGGLLAAQVLMGHYRATTTDLYVRSAGLYADQQGISDAPGASCIGQAVETLWQKEMPHGDSRGAFCKLEIVNSNLQ